MWAEITGETGYEVSDQGEVKSQRKTLSQWTLERGQRAVKIRGKTYLVHLLVLQAFVGPRPWGAEPVWCNGDISDNRLVNLKWRLPDSPEVQTIVNRCRNGHVYSRENTRVWGGGNRVCLDCERGVAPVLTLPEVLR